ncbi:MAG: hypothetical protein DLM73_02330 [Chthoniobacterales bacterium]|nr:MAG: hypothetical protein DLM73_02330 [Chthoniobacterales bacterium]
MEQRPEPTKFARPLAACIQSLALIITIVGARLWLISVYSTSLPILDQWDAEAALLFKPWLENTLGFADLFTPHNDHRMFPSRLLALGLLRLNDQWDAQLEMVANAALCGLMGWVVATGLARIFGIKYRLPVFVAVALWLALPYGHENTLWGFQSAFYFLLFFSLVAIWGLGFFAPSSRHWWLGATAAAWACFSMGSGFFAAAAVLMLELLRIVSRRRPWRAAAPTFLLCLAMIALGCVFRVHFAPHDALKAATVGAWLSVFARCLAWPYIAFPIAAFLLYLPWGICSVALLRGWQGMRRTQFEVVFVGGLWVIVQAAAIAYARGEGGRIPIASRYMDILALGTLLNGVAVIVLVAQATPPKSALRTLATAGAALWLSAPIAGAGWLGFQKVGVGPGREVLRPMEENVRAYVETHDRSYLAGDIPYPSAIRLATLLDDPTIRKILPALVRAPLPIQMRAGTNRAFVPDGLPPELPRRPYEKIWGSYSDAGPAARGSIESEIFNSPFPYLRFETAADAQTDMFLQLRDEASGQTTRIRAKTPIDQVWRWQTVPAPGSELRLIASDNNSRHWLAFRQPRETGRWSFYAQVLVSQGKNVLISGTGLWAFLIIGALLRHRAREPIEPKA